MTSMKRCSFLLLGLFALPSAAIAWEIGPTVSYAAADKSLSVNGRLVNLKSGGIGVRVGESFLRGHVALDASALYGYSGSASATFSGAAVSGPANLTTTQINATIYWRPESSVTPYVRWGDMRRRGDTAFAGTRNGVPVVGRADLEFDQSELSVGLRLQTSGGQSFFAESGQNDWRLNSDANGTLGALNARTQIQASHSDPFTRFGLGVVGKAWRGPLSLGEYRMTADNQTKTRSIDASLMYAF